MWIVCITSVRHVLTVNGCGGRQTKENEKSWCFKGWETLVSNITLDDVIGATGTHESVHALDKYSNHVGQPDKSKREQNPILKEIEYIKKIKH